jgi:hypothetical protein
LDFYQVTSVPIKRKNDTYSFLSIEVNFLAIDKSYQNYFTPTKQEIASCIHTPEVLFCSDHKRVQNTKDKTCLMQLFFSQDDTQSCKEKYLKITKELWIRSATANSWLFVLPERTKVTLLCNQTQIEFLHGTGIIIVTGDNQIKTVKFQKNLII